MKLTNDQSSFIARLALNGPIAVLEYRGENPEIIKYANRESGKVRYMVKHPLACEFVTTGTQVVVELFTERGPKLKDDEDQPEPKLPPKLGLDRGTIILIDVAGYVNNMGAVTMRARQWCKLADADLKSSSFPVASDAANGEGAKSYNLRPDGASAPAKA